MLEVLERGSPSLNRGPSLVFVHGGMHAAWCWSEHFLGYFAGKGYHSLALSLSGHGGSPTTKPLNRYSAADYVNDICSVADTLPVPPIMLGHSLGGGLVQRYLRIRRSPGAVFLASVPPHGASKLMRRLAGKHPARAAKAVRTGSLRHYFATPGVVRDIFFCADTPDEIVVRCRASLQDESIAAVLSLMLGTTGLHRINVPALVIGGRLDNAITEPEVHQTAKAFGTAAEFFDLGHNMMLEPGWPQVADRIHQWLGDLL